MRKELILPGLAIAGGLVGFGLRKWELATAFEPSGLAIAGVPATTALVLFTVVMVLALALLSRGKHGELAGYGPAFAAKGNTVYMALMVAAALLMAAAGVLTLLTLPNAYLDVLSTRKSGSMFSILPQLLLGLLCFASAWCLLKIGRGNYRGDGQEKYNAALLIPAYTACMWLIVSYQARSGDPVVLDYAWQLFAIIAAVLGSYFMAGFAFERAKVFRAAWCMLCGVFFCIVTLADWHDGAMLLLYGAFLLYLLTSVVTLLYNAQRMPDAVTQTTQLEENKEDT